MVITDSFFNLTGNAELMRLRAVALSERGTAIKEE